ncbi:hypothetical protein ACFOU0_12340 [Salinicoccus sesuvii]|uniref:Uncharacterized protein n=1 Tax=Salinicoccus sesuvii TaxID=868281 RepID=A0ABV7N9T9_9STAP
MAERRRGRPTHAKVVEVIQVHTIVGSGDKEDPTRTVVDFYTKDGLHLAEIDNLTEPEYINLEEL